MTNNHLWYEKYRPRTAEDYIWRDEDLGQRVREWIATPSKIPNMIIGGPPGTGKTSLALLLKNHVIEDESDFLFLNGSKFSGVETVRSTVSNFCETGGFNGIKIVLYDEAERLTQDAQEALRGVIDEFTNVRFIFTCNAPRRIVDALKSRCRTLTLDTLVYEDYVARLCQIYMAEADLTDFDVHGPEADIIYAISESCYPDMRKGIDTLEDCFRNGKLVPLKESNVKQAPVWENALLGVITKNKPIADLREVVDSISLPEINDVYSYLVYNIEHIVTGDEKQKAAAILIADHEYRHNIVTYANINLLAMIVKLCTLIRS